LKQIGRQVPLKALLPSNDANTPPSALTIQITDYEADRVPKKAPALTT
jgi:hypothetical protein